MTECDQLEEPIMFYFDMYESVVLGSHEEQSSMPGYFNVTMPIPDFSRFSRQEVEGTRSHHDIELEKFFGLIEEVSNGVEPLLKYKDDDCMQKCIKIKWTKGNSRENDLVFS